MLLTREATEKDCSLKAQMLVTTAQNETRTEPIWQKKKGFFGDEHSDFNISKNNLPENMYCYVKNGSVSTVKGGETVVYLQILSWVS